MLFALAKSYRNFALCILHCAFYIVHFTLCIKSRTLVC